MAKTTRGKAPAGSPSKGVTKKAKTSVAAAAPSPIKGDKAPAGALRVHIEACKS